MKKLFLLTKTLLAVALLCVGQTAWGDAAITRSWTFTGLDANTAITKSEASLTEAGTTCNLATAPSCCAGLYFNENWQVYQKGDSNPGLRNISSGDRMVIIPNLKKGDIITITGNSDAINNINTTKYTGTKDDVKNTLTFTMSADGNFYFKMVKSGGKVNDVTVYPSIKSIVVTHDYAKVYEANYEDAETYASGWTFSNISPSQGENGTNKYLLLTQTKSGTASISFANNVDFSNADNYRFSFDCNMNYHVGSRTTTISVKAIKDEADITLFKIVSKDNVEGYNSTSHVQNSNSEDLATFTNGGYGNSATMTPSNSFVILSNSSGTTLTINSGNPITLSNGLVTIKEITISTGNSSALKESFDNMVMRVEVSTFKTRASNAITEYNSIKNSVMNSSVKSALDVAYNTLNTNFDTDEEIEADFSGYVSAIEALENAIPDAEESAADFKMLNQLIANANSSAPAGYEAPSGATTIYTENADVDAASLITAVRTAIITAGVANENTDITALIINNSFELQTTFGWTTIPSNDTGARNNNSPYTTSGIDGSYQFNTWSQGTPITQTIGTLPEGKYKLACKVASDADNVIYLTVNESHNAGTTATGKGTYLDAEYIFSLGESTEVTIGAVGGNTDGSYIAEGGKWYKADKFTITYLGEDPLEVAKKALNDEIDAATDVKNAWTPKVGTAPFKYNSTYYDALVTELGEANAVKTGGSDDPDDYTTAKTELEGTKDAIASSVLNEPASDKFYRLYLAEGGVSTGKNLNMLKYGAGNTVITEAPYPVKFVKSGDNYIIQNPYNYYVASNRTSNSNWGTFIDLNEDDKGSIDEELKPTTMYVNANVWGVEPQEDGTFKMLSQQATWKAWGWYLGTWSSSEGAKVAAYDGNASPKDPTITTWLCSGPVDVTDVNLAVNATTGWGTFIAPYDNLTPSTVKAYTVSHKDGNIVYFEENETGVLSANTPYILSTEESSNVAVAFKGIANNDENTYEVNGLVGLLAAETVPANSYILQYQAEKVGTAFYKLASDMTGTAYRCYLNLASVSTVQNARATVRMNIFGGITGVENVEVSAENALKDGKYLENGKIVIVKAGKKFSATGAKLY